MVYELYLIKAGERERERERESVRQRKQEREGGRERVTEREKETIEVQPYEIIISKGVLCLLNLEPPLCA
jgi:hypothetical protein